MIAQTTNIKTNTKEVKKGNLVESIVAKKGKLIYFKKSA